MDNLCHTLVGAAIAESGSRKWTPLATATVLIGANLPDVDALAYLDSPLTALNFRRGWTHGVLAMAVGPFVLAGLMLAWDRWVRRRRTPDAPPARAGALLALAAIAVVSHPLLDLLNVYGVRLLMPFSARWFFGDALFIVDPWVWVALAAGAFASRRLSRRDRARATWPARAALATTAVYAALMWASGVRVAGTIAASDRRFPVPERIMVAPDPLNPFHRTVLLQVPGAYLIGAWRWFDRPRLHGPWVTIPIQSDAAAALAAARTPAGRTFLTWARFPYYAIAGGEGCPPDAACIRDARYPDQGWAEVAVPLPRALSSPPPPPPEEP